MTVLALSLAACGILLAFLALFLIAYLYARLERVIARLERVAKPTEAVLAAAALCDQFATCQQGQETAIVKLSARVKALEEPRGLDGKLVVVRTTDELQRVLRDSHPSDRILLAGDFSAQVTQ